MKNQGKNKELAEDDIVPLSDIISNLSKKNLIKLNRNEHLYRQNDPIKGIFYLITGKIKIVQKEKDEIYHVINSVKAPDLIGLSSILCDEFYPNSAYSVEESNIFFIPKKEFLEELSKNRQLAINVMKLLCTKIDKTEAQIPLIN